MNYPHTLVIERAAAGALDDRGVEAQTYTALATVPGWAQPKSVREMSQLSQAGPVTSDWSIYLGLTDVTEADRLRLDPDDGRTWEVDGIKDEAGFGHHLKLDCHLVEVS
jgi:hypothetical protein